MAPHRVADAGLWLLLIGAVGGCGKAAPEAVERAATERPSAQIVSPGSGAPSRAIPPRLSEPFRAAFGRDGGVITRKGFTYRFRPAELVDVDDGMALVSVASGPDCHACEGAVAIDYLRRGDEGLVPRRTWRRFDIGSAWGQPLVPILRRDLLGSTPIVQLDGEDHGLGYQFGYATLVRLERDGPKVIADGILTHYDDRGAVEDESKAIEFDGRIIPGDSREFAVRYSGSGGGTVRYRDEGKGFVPVIDPALPAALRNQVDRVGG